MKIPIKPITPNIRKPRIMDATILLYNVDLTMLRRQKHELCQINYELLDKRQQDSLDGIIHLCDAIQDYAVDVLKMNPKKIYFLNSKP